MFTYSRHYLQAEVVVDGRAEAPVVLLTTHLESTKSEKAMLYC